MDLKLIDVRRKFEYTSNLNGLNIPYQDERDIWYDRVIY